MNQSKRRSLPKNVKDMSKGELEEALKKKKECSARALKIVETMLETPVNEEWFMDSLEYIRQSHFEDIVEERSILKICGYPLCCGVLKDVSAHQFHISLKHKKVYDTTERKKYCSNQCYRAGKYLKDQLLTSPLWFNDYEETSNFKLLPITSEGMLGEEVILRQGSHCNTVEPNEECIFTSTNKFVSDSLTVIEMRSSEILDNMPLNKMKVSEVCEQKLSNPVLTESSCQCNTLKITMCSAQGQTHSCVENTTSESSKIDNIFLSKEDIQSPLAVRELTSKLREDFNSESGRCRQYPRSRNIDNVIVNDTAIKKAENLQTSVKGSSGIGNTNTVSVVLHVETCLREWFNLETMIFLFGEDKVKEMIIEKGKSIKEYYKVISNTSWDPKLQERYESVCKRLNIMDFEDSHYDQNLIMATKELKPLPDYSVIKEEGEKLEMKVSAFYQGKLNYREDVGLEKDIDELPADPLLPLVDTHAQKCYRRKIVIDRLNKVVPDFLRTFGLASQDYSSECRALVRTFALEAHNIFFKPAEWNLLGLIIINMLAVKDRNLRAQLDTDQAKNYQTLMLIPYQQDSGYIDKFITWLINIDNLVDTPKETH